MKLRDHIADLVNEDRHNGWYGSISGSDITTVEVRRGCGEIEVTFKDGETTDSAIVDAAEVLTEVLQRMIDEEAS